MPNCTAYAWGRAYEILNHIPNLSTSDAGKWFEYNKKNNIYSYGQTPKLGAIACFDNKDGGHVAVVENIENNIITFSISAYGGNNFYLSKALVDSENPGQENWIFQGYIYLKELKDEIYSINSTYKVVSENGVNLRVGANVNSKIIKVVPEKEELFIINVIKNQNHNWGLTYYNGKIGYCALEYTNNISKY